MRCPSFINESHVAMMMERLAVDEKDILLIILRESGVLDNAQVHETCLTVVHSFVSIGLFFVIVDRGWWGK